jgi:hypothetical protein
VGRLINLQDVSLSKNNFTTTLPSELGQLQKLTSLFISDMGLMTGQLPAQVGSLLNLKSLDASSNKLTGRIPDDIWKIIMSSSSMSSLSSLNNTSTSTSTSTSNSGSSSSMTLLHNELVGAVPPDICAHIDANNKIDLKVDCFKWLAEPEVSCACCHSCDNPSMLFTTTTTVSSSTSESETSTMTISPNNNNKNNINKRTSDSDGNDSDSDSNSANTSENSNIASTSTSTGSQESVSFDYECPGDMIEIVGDYFNYWELLDLNSASSNGNSNGNNDADGNGNSSSKERKVLTRIDAFEEDEGRDLRHRLCVSRASCFRLRVLANPTMPQLYPFQIVSNGEVVYESPSEADLTGMTQFDVPLVGYQQGKEVLVEGKCDAFPLCGTALERGTLRREIFNHILELAEWDQKLMQQPTSPQYEAACWLVTSNSNQIQDLNLAVSDGSAMQRFVLALLHYHNDAWKTKNSYDGKIYGELDATLGTCDWDGITCDGLGYITEIDLSEDADAVVNGGIPSEIGYLTSLKKLRLNGDGRVEEKLRGTLPTEIGRLHNLEELDLGNHEIGGELPHELFELTNLRRLVLFSNRIEGTLSPSVTLLGTLGTSNATYLPTYVAQLTTSCAI